MLKITVDPSVLAKLKLSFPKANKAKNALDKYVTLFEDVLNNADKFGRSKYEIKLGLYSLNLRRFSQEGPCIGGNTLLVHKWLADNDLLFYEVVTLGSNLNKRYSQVKLNSLVEVVSPAATIGKQLREATTDDEITQLLAGDLKSDRELFINTYPDYLNYQTSEKRKAVFDFIPVDEKSLMAYIIFLNRAAKDYSQNTIDEKTKTAFEILSISRVLNGYFPQRKKQSYFGRMYYSGKSIQSVSKDLRKAILGDCWDLDLRSSVIAFKMIAAKSYVEACEPDKNYQQVFSATRWYLNERDSFVKTVCSRVFGHSKELDDEKKYELIKEAVTAISFGARANAIGWQLNDGTWKNPALKKIFKKPEWHEKFIADREIKDFIVEQQKLDAHFEQLVKQERPEIFKMSILQAGNKTSRSKLMSYIYQQQETVMMDAVRAHLESIGKPAIASIHDGVLVKQQLVNGQLPDVTRMLREKFDNKYLTMRQKKVDGFKRYSIEPEHDFEVPSVEKLLSLLGFANIEDWRLTKTLYA
jgi:hypothetical protein